MRCRRLGPGTRPCSQLGAVPWHEPGDAAEGEIQRYSQVGCNTAALSLSTDSGRIMFYSIHLHRGVVHYL